MTQNFKGDATEIQFQDAAKSALDVTSASLTEFYNDCYDADDFLLMLYDSGRMPFSSRVPRESFIAFIRQAIPNFPKTGTFEAYIFILKAIFGESTSILFDVPGPGELDILVNAEASLQFFWEGREFVEGGFESFTLQTFDGFDLVFTGISGIDSEAELTQLLSEIIPAGIFTDIALTFFELHEWIAVDTDENTYSVIDNNGNTIVFFE